MIGVNRSSLAKLNLVTATIGALALATIVACSDDESGGSPGTGGSGGGSGGSGGSGATGGSATGGTGGTGGSSTGGTGGSAGSGGGTGCTVTPPSEWSAPNWEANTQEALALRGRVGALTGSTLMQGAELGTAPVTVDLTALTTAYEAGTPSLKSAASASFDGIIADAFEEFLAAVAAGAQDLVSAGGDWQPGAEGGIWSTSNRAFNEGGIEVRQIVDKGLFGGALYNYALGLTTGTINEATIDALAAAFGANPALNPGRNDDAVVENRNTQSANYVYRMGFFAEAKQALIEAKAFAADDACTTGRDASIQTFFRTWEQGLLARFVFYSNAGVTEITEAMDDEGLAGGLHEQAEGLGLAMGFLGIANPTSGPMSAGARVMTDDHITTALSALGVNVTGDLGAATLGGFVANSFGYTTAVGTVEDVVADVFNLTEADLESYRAPTDG
jgi:hypothetical protein